jgi:phage recombination protein Bet
MRTASASRQRAYSNEAQQIEASQQRAIAARETESKRPRNALEALAGRLEVSPAGLRESLLETVFKGCRNESEFIALVIVANAYGLNPLTKEIYAFPGKGGGIVPMISVDGWIKIMNSHPQFDGIEFEYTMDGDNVSAIESIIYRKDRDHPIKTIEFMEECKRGTEPWKLMPRRMLRNRALIQGVRIAFGVSAQAEGDENVIEGNYQPVEPRSLPNRSELARELDDEIPNFDRQADPQTGEIFDRDERGFTQVDEETARQLDAGNDGAFSPENPNAREGRDDGQMGEQHANGDEPEAPYLEGVRELRKKLAGAKSVRAVEGIDRDWCNGLRDSVEQGDPNLMRGIDRDIADKKRKLQAEG